MKCFVVEFFRATYIRHEFKFWLFLAIHIFLIPTQWHIKNRTQFFALTRKCALPFVAASETKCHVNRIRIIRNAMWIHKKCGRKYPRSHVNIFKYSHQDSGVSRNGKYNENYYLVVILLQFINFLLAWKIIQCDTMTWNWESRSWRKS